MGDASQRNWTYRDAGQLALPLRALNGVGKLVPAMRTLVPDRIIEKAMASTGLEDFAGDEWREGLRILCESGVSEAKLSAFGFMVQRNLCQTMLEQRLRLVDYSKKHMEVREEKISAPIIVLGMPRTGTTLLSYLLDLDPQSRSLLSWESMDMTPPPTLAGQQSDPRIAAADKQEEQMAKLIPPMAAMHPLGATQPTECIPFLMMDFRSLGFETQMMVPAYGEWLEQCDMSSAYRLHKLALQTLQSTIPAKRWALKTPQHLWSIPALLGEYPDAKLVWTHRDPAKVVPSASSLSLAFYRTFSNRIDPVESADYWMSKLQHAVQAGIAYDESAENSGWCHHLLYEDLIADPVEAVRSLYQQHLGEELDSLHERRMQLWMQNRPQNTYGRHRYDIADFGLTDASIREQFGAYMQRFNVPNEGSVPATRT